MKTQEEIYRGAEERFWKCNGRDFEEHEVTQLEKQQYVSGYLGGYTQCQQDMAEKKLDEDDIKEMALDFIINIGDLPKTIEEWHKDLWKFYQSLNKQDNEN